MGCGQGQEAAEGQDGLAGGALHHQHTSIGAWPLWRSGAQARQICHPLGALPSKYHTLCVLLLDDAAARGWKLRSERRQDNTAQDAGVTFVYLWQLKKGTALAATWAWPELDPVGA